MNRWNKAATAAALIALTASTAMGQERAQERRHEHAPPPQAVMPGECLGTMGPMMGGMMGHGMMGGGVIAAMSPSMILRQREALGLDDSQVEKLESLSEQATEARAEHMQRMQPIHERMAAALQGDSADLAAYETALREMADEMVGMHLQAARTAQEALTVLTPDQRANVRYGMRLMQEMHGRRGMGDMMGMGMEGCPIMEGMKEAGMMGGPE